jgi:uncharacterized phiE125 gp8 family phage protein
MFLHYYNNKIPEYIIKTYPTTFLTDFLTLSQVKAQLNIDITDISEDVYLTNLIEAVYFFIEKYTNRYFLNQVWILYLDAFPYCNSIPINKSYFKQINSIKYYPTTWDGIAAPTTFASTNYYVTNETSIYDAQIVLKSDVNFPMVYNRLQAVEVEFQLQASVIPFDVKQAALQMIAYLYTNKGDCGCDESNMPTSALNLLSGYKRYVL